MKYSVIIPVYKAENTIERCLESLLNQPHKDIEILIINDGSPDESGSICKKYTDNYSCVRYFEKENGGVSSARNLGLDEATGEYVLFVDSDDYVAQNYFETIERHRKEKLPDLLLFGYQNFGSNNNSWNTGDYYVYGEREVSRKVDLAIREYLFSSLWSKAFKRSIIKDNNLKFDIDLLIGEDQAFIFQFALYVKNIVSISETLYYVGIENAGSLSRKCRDYLAEQLLKGNIDMLEALDNVDISEESREIYCGALAWIYYRSAYSACKELLKYKITAIERRKKIKQICNMYTMRRVVPCDVKCKMIAIPVIWNMSYIIDFLIKWSDRRRKRINKKGNIFIKQIEDK